MSLLILLEHHYLKSEETVCELWDVSSLYPYVAKVENYFTQKFFVLTQRSIRKRIKITKNDILLDGKPFHGFAQVRVIPPRDLELPYLGMLVNLKVDNESIEKSDEFEHKKKCHTTQKAKNNFPAPEHQIHVLCSACSSSQPPTRCQHSDQKRSILTVVSADEIRYMLELNYKIPIKYIFELWVYKESSKKPIFKKYMQMMEIEKIKSSKIPTHMIGREAEYCKMVNDELNCEFKLKPENLQENKVRRSIMKR